MQIDPAKTTRQAELDVLTSGRPSHTTTHIFTFIGLLTQSHKKKVPGFYRGFSFLMRLYL